MRQRIRNLPSLDALRLRGCETLLAMGFTLSGCGLIQVHYSSSSSVGTGQPRNNYSHARALSEGRARNAASTNQALAPSQAGSATAKAVQPSTQDAAAWTPSSMPATLTRVKPNLALPLPKPRPERDQLAGIALGMTESEVLASCSHRTNPTINEVRPALDRNGEEVNANTDPRRLLGGSYLRNITCFSRDTGLTDIGFAPLPYQRVVQIHHSDYRITDGKSVPEDRYFGPLATLYGKPADRIGPEKIHGDRWAMTYKWLMPTDALDLDCAPPTAQRERVVFGEAMLSGMPCATQVTVRVALENPSAPQAFAADYALVNLRTLADAERAHIELVNKTYGTSLVDTTTRDLENRGRTLLCEMIAEHSLQSYLSGKREQATDSIVERVFPKAIQSFMKRLINDSSLDDKLFAGPSRQGAVAMCQIIFAIYDQHQAELPK